MENKNMTDPTTQLFIEVETKKIQRRQVIRSLVWYVSTTAIVLIILILGIAVSGIFGTLSFIGGWATFVAVIFSLVLLFLVIYFFVDYKGFSGLSRIGQLISLKNDIYSALEQIRIAESYQYKQQPPESRYKTQLPQLIARYQREANSYRRTHYTIQIIIILLSLLVTGLTSGLTGLVGITDKPWLAPLFSLCVSFLTALTALFRFRDRGFNLQQTADAIEFEIAACELRIFDYKGLADQEALRELAERAERLKNEQRKRQQQLEQASDTKHSAE